MPLLYLLPLTAGIVFLISILLIIINSKDKNKMYLLLYCFMLTTTLVIAIAETIVIYKFHGLDNTAINDKFIFFVIAILMNVFALISKPISVIKELKKETPEYASAIIKMLMIDPLCLGVLIMMILVFRV